MSDQAFIQRNAGILGRASDTLWRRPSLLIFLLIMNAVAIFLRKKFERRW